MKTELENNHDIHNIPEVAGYHHTNTMVLVDWKVNAAELGKFFAASVGIGHVTVVLEYEPNDIPRNPEEQDNTHEPIQRHYRFINDFLDPQDKDDIKVNINMDFDKKIIDNYFSIRPESIYLDFNDFKTIQINF